MSKIMHNIDRYMTGVANRKRSIVTATALILVALPLLITNVLGSQYWVRVFSELFVFGIVVLSYDLIFGYTGVISFGHALMFGGAAYLLAILMSVGFTFPVSLVASVVLVTLFSAIFGLISLYRLGGGVYFAIVTLAVAQLGYFLVLQSTEITGGDNGTFISVPAIIGVNLTAPLNSYYITLSVMVLVYIALRRLVNSPFGRIIQGIRDNEERMEAIGVNVYRYKVISFTISGFVAAIAGVMFPIYSSFLSPNVMYWTTTGDILIMSLIGGFGTLWGPVVGAGTFILSENLLAELIERWLLVFGIIFILFILHAPEGIAGLTEDKESDRFRSIRTRFNQIISRGGNQK